MERLYKGKSLTNKLSDFVVIDLETTGFMPDYDEIIEFSGIKISNGKIVDEYSTLIKPSCGIDTFVSSLTGITNEMFEDSPSIEMVIDRIMEFIGDSIIVGHNINFDINFLYDNLMIYRNKPLTNDFEDTLKLARKLFKDFPNHQLTTCTSILNKEYFPTHRAMSDVKATYELLTHIYEYVDANNIDLVDLFKPKYTGRSINVHDIVTTVNEIDEDNPLYGLSVCFTGTLDNMVRKDALQMVKNLGGIPMDSVTKHTNLLVLGDLDYKENKLHKSNKYKKAEELILKGCNLKIISESVFLDMIDDNIEFLYYRKS